MKSSSSCFIFIQLFLFSPFFIGEVLYFPLSVAVIFLLFLYYCIIPSRALKISVILAFILFSIWIFLIYIYGVTNSDIILNRSYYFWPFYTVVAGCIYLNYFYLIENSSSKVMKATALSLLIVIFILSVYAFFDGARRLHAGFGPNVLYRLVLSLYAFHLFCYTRFKGDSGWLLIIGSSSIFTIYCISEIGSRGGVLSFLLMVSIFFYFEIKRFNLSFFSTSLAMIGLFSGAIYAILLNLEFLRNVFARAIYFDINNTSENFRFRAIQFYFDWLGDVGAFEFLFGEGVGASPYALYPHNILIELHFYYGAIAAFPVLGILIFCSVWLIKERSALIFLLIPSLVGSFLSGSIYDNFYLISFLAAASIYISGAKSQTRRVEVSLLT